MKRRRFLHMLLSMLTAVSLTVFLITVLLYCVLTDREVYRSAAMAGISSRKTVFENRVREIAEAVSFSPETALRFYPDERIAAIAEKRAMWLPSLLSGESPELPDLSCENLTDAILEDPLFSGNSRRAREEGTYEVERAAERAFLPVRFALLERLVDKVNAHVLIGAVLHTWIARLPWLTAGVSAILCLLLLLVSRRHLSSGFCLMGASLAAGGVGAAALAGLPLAALRIPALIREVSPLFAEEISMILSVFLRRHMIICAAVLLAGLLLFWTLRGRSEEAS